MHRELANTEATSILRRKREEGGKRSVPVLLYGSDPNSSDPIYRHCAACKAPQHLTVQCQEWPAAKPRSSLPPPTFRLAPRANASDVGCSSLRRTGRKRIAFVAQIIERIAHYYAAPRVASFQRKAWPRRRLPARHPCLAPQANGLAQSGLS